MQNSYDYEINKGTLCLIQEGDNSTKVIEINNEYEVNKNIHKIIDESCRSFGSTLKGRNEGTKDLTGIKYKAPIIISEYLSIIMIPTGSTRGNICHWISLNSIKRVEKDENNLAIIEFINGKNVRLDVSYYVVENQLAKAVRLDYCLKKKYA